MALWGEPGAMIHACSYTFTTDDLHMQEKIKLILKSRT